MPSLLLPFSESLEGRTTQQAKLLKKAEESGEPLSAILRAAGLTYDDLVYERSGSRIWDGRAPVILDNLRSKLVDIPAVSFFTGCGGVDLGLEAAGYQHIAAFEINELFCKTLRRNRPRMAGIWSTNTFRRYFKV